MGTPLPEIMQQVGHKQLGTTQLYSTALPDRDDRFQDDWDAWRGTYG